MTTDPTNPTGGDDGESFDIEDEPLTDEQLANVDKLVAQQEAVAAVEDPLERREAARWYYAALAGYPEPEELWS